MPQPCPHTRATCVTHAVASRVTPVRGGLWCLRNCTLMTNCSLFRYRTALYPAITLYGKERLTKGYGNYTFFTETEHVLSTDDCNVECAICMCTHRSQKYNSCTSILYIEVGTFVHTAVQYMYRTLGVHAKSKTCLIPHPYIEYNSIYTALSYPIVHTHLGIVRPIQHAQSEHLVRRSWSLHPYSIYLSVCAACLHDVPQSEFRYSRLI
jgi:hypothetical protein